MVCIIWASGFVVVKIALSFVKPLTLSGVRYFGGFLLLLPLMALRGELKRDPAPGHWWHLLVIGLCAYTIGNGTLFWGLQFLSATTGSFLLTLIPIPVLFLGILRLKEIPSRWQFVGLLVALAGGALFFSPGLHADELLAVGVVGVGLLAFGVFGVVGREVARSGQVKALTLTAIPLGLGGGIGLLVAGVIEGLPNSGWPLGELGITGWVSILWLVVINTALAYWLYNHALQSLTALEMNVLLNLSPLVTAIVAAMLLHEQVSPVQLMGMVVLILGVSTVQWGRKDKVGG